MLSKVFKILIVICILIIIYPLKADSKPRSGYGTPYCQYIGGNGIEITSYCKNWSTKYKLQEVYKELLENCHGEEIKYLSNIYIYPDSPDGVAGFYYDSYERDYKGRYLYHDKRYIEIFHGDKYGEISEIARVLSHEYGHHFTSYYMITEENKTFSEWEKTRYAKIRNLVGNNKVTYYYKNNKEYNHEWDISEIMAEDYVQLMGSPLARKSINYKDVKERIDEDIKEYYYYSSTFNLLPQENLDIPLATNNKNLYDYYMDKIEKKKKIKLKEIKTKVVISEIKEVYKNYKQYKIEWDEIKDNEFYEYTLVLYPKGKNDFPQPIKTVCTGESMVAIMGSAISQYNDGKANALLERYVGEYTLQLFIKDENNYIYNGDVVNITFDNNGDIVEDTHINKYSKYSMETVAIDKKNIIEKISYNNEGNIINFFKKIINKIKKFMNNIQGFLRIICVK